MQGHRHLTVYISACNKNILIRLFLFSFKRKFIYCQASAHDAWANQLFQLQILTASWKYMYMHVKLTLYSLLRWVRNCVFQLSLIHHLVIWNLLFCKWNWNKECLGYMSEYENKHWFCLHRRFSPSLWGTIV